MKAGSGRVVAAGSGKKTAAGRGRGQWRTYDVTDGLAGAEIYAIHQDRNGNLWFGTRDGGLSRYDGEEWMTFTVIDGLAHNVVSSILQDREGNLWFGTHGGVSCYDGEEWTTFTTADGLAADQVRCILQDREDNLWMGTWGGGLSRYDGEQFRNYSTRDNLANDYIRALFQDLEGNLWFGTLGGLSRYNRESIISFTVWDGLGHDIILSLLQDRDGSLWFGTDGGGVSRYDGVHFTTFTMADGLGGNRVRCIFQDLDGRLWFGTANGGVSRYDGERFTTFTTADGLGEDSVHSILQDREGVMWFGTWGGGVSRYDGECFTTFTTADGLFHNDVVAICQDREGVMWLATWGGGVSRYDGECFTVLTEKDGLTGNEVRCVLEDREGVIWLGAIGGANRCDGGKLSRISTEDGLAYDQLHAICQDRDGHFWFATYGGGVSHWDGRVFQSLAVQDGLAHNQVTSILESREGDMWFGTLGGVTRYRPFPASPPLMVVDEVVADRHYAGTAKLTVPSSAKLVVFGFHGVSLKTRPGGMIYCYRLRGYEEEWKTTRERKVEYEDLVPGKYEFQVTAIDRDLVYSEPAVVELKVVPDPRIEALSEALSATGTVGEFVGKSQALRQVQELLVEVAGTEVTVLIQGETGTGKGLAAHTIHGLSSRKTGPFIQVNCGAVPESLVESELFGHERGAFTGAVSRKLGKVELADGGTLFLDEIGDLPMVAQVKLLRLLDEHTFERVGGTGTIKPDVRIVAATNRDLQQMVKEGQFREDLFFRLQVFPVQLPLLSERREDIPLLAVYFMERMATHLHKGVSRLTPEALEAMRAYDWPGNVREMEHAIQRAVIVCRGEAIQVGDIPLEPGGTAGEEPDEELVTLEIMERNYISRVLERAGWVIGGEHGAAAILGLNESTLRGRMRKLGIKRP